MAKLHAIWMLLVPITSIITLPDYYFRHYQYYWYDDDDVSNNDNDNADDSTCVPYLKMYGEKMTHLES